MLAYRHVALMMAQLVGFWTDILYRSGVLNLKLEGCSFGNDEMHDKQI